MSIWPPIIYIGLLTLNFGVVLSKKNASDFFTLLISVAIMAPLLYWGGFFDVLMR